jgi:uncharacterized protein
VRLDHAVEVPLPLAATWTLLQDLPRLAPHLPGAHLDEVVDGEYRGGLARYAGTARFLERDEIDHRAVLRVRGQEEHGGGSAAVTITATLHDGGAGTRVDLLTELTLGGSPRGGDGATEAGATYVAALARGLVAAAANGGAGAAPPAEAVPAAVVGPRPGPAPRRRRTSVAAVTVTVAAVLAGVGLGAWWLGRRARRVAEG